MKLFEILIYPFSREELVNKVSNARLKYEVRLQNPLYPRREEHLKKCSAMRFYPFSLWDYNHIIGAIVVKKEHNDIIIDQYVPAQDMDRYRWDSTKKKYLMNAQLIGNHFYIGNMKNGSQLRDELHQYINSLIERIEKQGRFVDREAFDVIDQFLDYDKLLKG